MYVFALKRMCGTGTDPIVSDNHLTSPDLYSTTHTKISQEHFNCYHFKCSHYCSENPIAKNKRIGMPLGSTLLPKALL